MVIVCYERKLALGEIDKCERKVVTRQFHLPLQILEKSMKGLSKCALFSALSTEITSVRSRRER